MTAELALKILREDGVRERVEPVNAADPVPGLKEKPLPCVQSNVRVADLATDKQDAIICARRVRIFGTRSRRAGTIAEAFWKIDGIDSLEVRASHGLLRIKATR